MKARRKDALPQRRLLYLSRSEQTELEARATHRVQKRTVADIERLLSEPEAQITGADRWNHSALRARCQAPQPEPRRRRDSQDEMDISELVPPVTGGQRFANVAIASRPFPSGSSRSSSSTSGSRLTSSRAAAMSPTVPANCTSSASPRLRLTRRGRQDDRRRWRRESRSTRWDARFNERSTIGAASDSKTTAHRGDALGHAHHAVAFGHSAGRRVTTAIVLDLQDDRAGLAMQLEIDATSRGVSLDIRQRLAGDREQFRLERRRRCEFGVDRNSDQNPRPRTEAGRSETENGLARTVESVPRQREGPFKPLAPGVLRRQISRRGHIERFGLQVAQPNPPGFEAERPVQNLQHTFERCRHPCFICQRLDDRRKHRLVERRARNLFSHGTRHRCAIRESLEKVTLPRAPVD